MAANGDARPLESIEVTSKRIVRSEGNATLSNQLANPDREPVTGVDDSLLGSTSSVDRTRAASGSGPGERDLGQRNVYSQGAGYSGVDRHRNRFDGRVARGHQRDRNDLRLLRLGVDPGGEPVLCDQ